MNNFSIQVVGIVAGCITSISMIPQLIKLIKAKEAKQISVFMIILLIIGISFWIFYGFLKQDLPIVVTNSFSFLINLLTLMFTLKYKRLNK